MNTNNKISLIIDTHQLFDVNDQDILNFLNGDIYLLGEIYKKSLIMIKRNLHYKFKHIITNEIMTLSNWMKYYNCDINDPDSITIFLRYVTLALKGI